MRIGITQRVEYIAQYSETRDSLDQRWIDLLESLEMIPIPIPNTSIDIKKWLESTKCDAYIITGGNDLSFLDNSKNTSQDRDKTEYALLEYAKISSKPILGVCRGLQIMNVFFGGTLKRVSGHVTQSHTVKLFFDQNNNPTSRKVNSFHEWGITKNDLATELTPCGFDEENNIEAAMHKGLNWLGIMWHPERGEEFNIDDCELIKNFFNGALN